ncbi:MAG TPA: transposase [Pyrinomonadaceae bacterium]|nr:transposase [Pyrinomonadaceae bacterium]
MRGWSAPRRKLCCISAVPSDVRKSLTFRQPQLWCGAMPQASFQISRDTPALYITIVTKNRLPVFRLDNIKRVICEALNEARESGAFLIFAYVIMPDHLHLLTNQPKTSADVLRYLKGITARRTIDYLRQNNFQSSLAKLQHESWKRENKYSLWQKEKNVFSIYSEAMFMQKVNSIHLNPVRARLVERAVDYR